MTNKLALVVAVALGVLSILGIRLYVQGLEKRNRDLLEPVDCLVAAKDLPAGRTFTSEDVESASFPRQAIDQAYRNSRITDRTTIIGARVVNPIQAGQILQTYHFAQTRTTKKFDLKSDQRAVTIPISRVSGVAGLLKPTDQVDVVCFSSFTDSTSKSVALTRTAFRNVTILATDGITDPFDINAGTGYATVTLRLSPEDCNKLLHNLYSGAAIHLVYVPSGTPPAPGFDVVENDDLYREIQAELDEHRRAGRGR